MRILGLASQSIGRKQLLELINIKFVATNPRVDEEALKESYKDKSPEELVQILALKKVQSVAEELFSLGAELIVGADTLIIFHGEILGKPKDKNQAIEMLGKLSNSHHNIITGIAIITPNSNHITAYERTTVYFNNLTQETIIQYVDLFQPERYAGGYKLLGPGAFLIRKIEGDFSNVIGLPLNLLGKMLEQSGYNWIEFVKKV